MKIKSIFINLITLLKIAYHKVIIVLNSLFKFCVSQLKKHAHFCMNILIGTLIAFLFHFIEGTQLGENTLNKVFDASLGSYYEEDPSTDKIFFIDIDESTLNDWGNPYFTPLDSLSKAIQICLLGKAKVIFIDISLDDRKSDFVSTSLLKNTLSSYTALNVENQNTHIIFPKIINSNRKIEDTLVDSIVTQNENFHFGIPIIYSSSSDKVTRYINYYTTYTNNGEERYILNTALLATLLFKGYNDKDLEALKLKLASNEKYSIPFNDNSLSISNKDIIANRIKFYYQFGNNYSNHLHLNYSNRIEYNNITDELKNLIKDKIVIIGVSDKSHSDDYYMTPVGQMPGMYIMGNAIYELINYKQLKTINYFYIIMIELITIIFAAILFMRYDSVLAFLIATIILLVALGPITIYAYYKKGIFINIVFPIIGMAIHKSIAEYEEAIEVLRKKR
jgi:CHASE2 domain-containing sensor protein